MARRRLGLLVLCLLAWALPTGASAPATASAFAIRGVILGSYGSIWSHAERMDMIRWLGAHDMNTFVYFPQEDPYTRERWREPFPDAAMAEFADEIALARSLEVRWGIGMRPGVPLFADDPNGDYICFSCDADFEDLAAKYKRFHDLGVRVFVLSIGDSAKASPHYEDLVRFGTGDAAFGRMTALLANRLQQRFPDSLVDLGPAEYSGTTPTEYLEALGHDLVSEVVVHWTGPQTASRSITAADADAYGAAVSPDAGPRRRLLVWDNFPTNDIYGEAWSAPHDVREQNAGVPERVPSLRLNFGPVKGRAVDLAGHVEGVLANPMLEPHASKIALYTLASYLKDPVAYAPDKAWLDGIRELGGPDAKHLFDVVSQMRSTLFDRTESPGFVARRDALVAAFAGARWEPAWLALVDELEAERDAGRALRETNRPSREFVAEAANHLATLELNTAAGLVAAKMLAAQRPSFASVQVERRGLRVAVSGRAFRAAPATVTARLAELVPAEGRARSSPFSVHGDRADALELVLWGGSEHVLENRMDQFLDWAHEATEAWLPLAAVAAFGPLAVTVNGTPVTLVDGSFSTEVVLVAGQKTIELVVTDAGGFRTSRSYEVQP